MSTTIILDEPVEIAVLASFEAQTQSGASASVIGVAIQVNGVDYDEYQRYLSGSNDQGIGAITHRTGEMAAGTYGVKLRYRRVSGVSTPGLNHADMIVMAMQGARGSAGSAGTHGTSGSSGTSGTAAGPAGSSGTSGSSGSSGISFGTDGTFNSVKITGDYPTAGTSGLVVNVYFGTAATMGTTGVPDGSLYFQYTA